MHEKPNWYNRDYNNVAAKTYTKCNGFLRQMLQELRIDPISASGGPQATNLALVKQVKSLLKRAGQNELENFAAILSPNDSRRTRGGEEKFRHELMSKVDNLPVAVHHTEKNTVSVGLMIDDIAPNAFKQSLAAVSAHYLSDERRCVILARKLFREVLDDLHESKIVRRKINVVEGNFTRMYSYLIEIYDENIGLSPYGRGNSINTAKVKFG